MLFINNLKNYISQYKYSNKFFNLSIDPSFAKVIMQNDRYANSADLLKLINQSNTKEEFSNNIIKNFKKYNLNYYAPTLLIGNITGSYIYYHRFAKNIGNIKLDLFTKENKDLIEVLKSHFYEYVMQNNKRKNSFKNTYEINRKIFRDYTDELVKEDIDEDFDQIINGYYEEYNKYKIEVVYEYLLKVLGTYSRSDILNNFDFILDDIDKLHLLSLDERRDEYIKHKSLNSIQKRRISDVFKLRYRLENMNCKDSKLLLDRLNKISNNYYDNIEELDNIYLDYEILFRNEIIDSLLIPSEDFTIITDYKDFKPQLIHSFRIDPKHIWFRENSNLINDVQANLINDVHANKDNKYFVFSNPQNIKRTIKNLKYRLDAQLDPYKVNYSYPMMLEIPNNANSETYFKFKSDTTNTICATLFNGFEFIDINRCGIIGIGFNKDGLCTESIGISSRSNKDSFVGINNIEYDESNEFMEFSSPLFELSSSNGNSELILFRRGQNFDSKASYIFAIGSSDSQRHYEHLLKELKKISEKENLKVVLFDQYEVLKSIQRDNIDIQSYYVQDYNDSKIRY